MKNRRKSRLAVELLEDRIVPSTFARVADVDGIVADMGLDGTFEYVDTTFHRIETSYFESWYGDSYESRGVLEFDISAIHVARLSIAMGHASPDVHAGAHQVTASNSADGWPTAIERYVLADLT